MKRIDMTRRDFLFAAAAGASAGMPWLSGCRALRPSFGASRYSVAILGDTHYDAEPESVYHSHYDESNRWAKVQHAEFVRNGEMWRERCPRMLAASAELARGADTSFVLQLGDIIQGDCDDAPTHRRMLDDCIRMLRAPYPEGIPFLTVMGNHDFRGKDARKAYLDFAGPFMSDEVEKLSGSRRHAVVLSGHTHTTNFYRHENRFGGFSEFTVNSVWCRPELATASPIHDRPADYLAEAERKTGGNSEDRRAEIGFFAPGLAEYFYSNGAGHYRMDVSDDAVTMAFYPGDALEPARRFALKT